MILIISKFKATHRGSYLIFFLRLVRRLVEKHGDNLRSLGLMPWRKSQIDINVLTLGLKAKHLLSLTTHYIDINHQFVEFFQNSEVIRDFEICIEKTYPITIFDPLMLKQTKFSLNKIKIQNFIIDDVGFYILAKK